jgi:hypothetical protein
VKGDFSRWTFDPGRDYSGVLHQQGRIQLDTGFNDAAAITKDDIRRLARMVIGPHGGDPGAFKVHAHGTGLVAGHGTYYVNGIGCQNARALPLPWFRARDLADDETYLVYLDLWEREVLSIQDPELIDPAIRHADSTLRTKVSWQVRFVPIYGEHEHDKDDDDLEWLVHKLWRFAARVEDGLEEIWKRFEAWLEDKPAPRERARDPDRRRAEHEQRLAWEPVYDAYVCRSRPPLLWVTPQSKYTGHVPALIRLEVHEASPSGRGATFKVSKDNGATVCPIKAAVNDKTVVVGAPPSGPIRLRKDDLVELVTDHNLRTRAPGPLLLLTSEVSPRPGDDSFEVTLSGPLDLPDDDEPQALHAFLRRWDAAFGILDAGRARRIGLGDGVEIELDSEGRYRRGDAWSIPVRVRTIAGSDEPWRIRSGIDWPSDRIAGEDRSRPQGPQDEHHFAPLAHLRWEGDRWHVRDLRRIVTPIATAPESEVEHDSEKTRDAHAVRAREAAE